MISRKAIKSAPKPKPSPKAPKGMPMKGMKGGKC